MFHDQPEGVRYLLYVVGADGEDKGDDLPMSRTMHGTGSAPKFDFPLLVPP